jgi:putative phosphoesterase
MKIAIISDIHDNILNLKKVLDYCVQNKIEKIICCGDLASLETLDFLNDNFAGEIFFVFGNMDNDYLKNYPFENNQYKNTKIFKDFGETEIDGNKVAFTHFPRRAKELCLSCESEAALESESRKYDFVFYGHTHKPFVSFVETTADQGKKKCKMLNPGNVANQIYPPTFAIWKTEENKFEPIRINELK